MALSRRQLLKALTASGIVVGTGAWKGLLADAATSSSSKKTLVVVQLAGGNDGLNTIVPDSGAYRDARPALAIPEADLLTPRGLTGYGLHPALAPMASLFTSGDVAVVQNVGLTHQGRSHFECSQHWWDGGDGHSLSDTGWLGRWLDATKPAGTANPLRALAIGAASATAALRADVSSATVIMEPSLFTVADAALKRALLWTGDPHITDALTAVDKLAAPLKGSGFRSDVGKDLELAADLVTADLGIEVLLVGANGYDTHSGQAATHERLLGQLATGIAAFQKAVTDAGMADRVLLLTTSEFGRRVAENGSAGTDHGLGNCLFAVGTGVRGGVSGDLDLARLHEGDIHPSVDPRSWMAVGVDFLGGPTDEVFESYEDLGVLA